MIRSLSVVNSPDHLKLVQAVEHALDVYCESEVELLLSDLGQRPGDRNCGTVHQNQLAWEYLAGEARIITISSSTTAPMLPGYAVYHATKDPVDQFTHIPAKEFGPRRITVNPGDTETETYRPGKSERFLAGLEAMSAFGRLGRPAEVVAAVVTFLASDAAGWVTTQNISVSGCTA
jgi:3-oxoacyl-[acyl-carrier protein] reductase